LVDAQRGQRPGRGNHDAYTRTNGYVVFTHDLDFSAILAATHDDKPSVVQIRAEDVSSGYELEFRGPE